MRGVASMSPVADMPLAFLVEQIGVACLADLWRIELQCDLPCKPYRQYPDAPLALLIGKLAKQGWEKGRRASVHPQSCVLPRSLPLRRWRTKSGWDARPNQPSARCLCQITDFSIPATRH